MELKRILMELGNKLVLESGFTPSGPRIPVADRSTVAITAFTQFVNLNLEAQEALKALGVDWAMVSEPVLATQSELNGIKEKIKLELLSQTQNIVDIFRATDSEVVRNLCLFALLHYAEMCPSTSRDEFLKLLKVSP